MAEVRLVPPLASIEETEDDDCLVGIVGSNSRHDGLFCGGQEAMAIKLPDWSPMSEDVSVHNPVDDLATDTGFFSTPSSKRNSLEALHSHGHPHYYLHLPKSATEDDILNDGDDDDILDDPVPVEHNTEAECSPELSGSLEDLVNSFDEAVTTCLRDYDREVKSLAPPQQRSAEDVIGQRPAWWTLTGNYGDMLPIDWEKLSRPLSQTSSSEVSLDECKTAEQVLAEMEQLISNNSESSKDAELQLGPVIRRTSIYRFSLDKLRAFPLDQLQELLEDLEGKVHNGSQELVSRLAHRDELEFERELKRTLLNLVAQVTARRRDAAASEARLDRYLNATIPYRRDVVPANLTALQALLHILRAMVDQSPAVSTLLTDYILTYVCPSGLKDHTKHVKDGQRSIVSLKAASRLFHRSTSQSTSEPSTTATKPILV